MQLSANNILLRFVAAVVIYVLFKALIDILVKQPKINEIFTVILILICIAIIFLFGFVIGL